MIKKITNLGIFSLVSVLLVGFNACSNSDMEELSTASKSSISTRSTVIGQADSIMFTRDPNGNAIGVFRMYGIKLTDDTYTGITSSLSTNSTLLDYQLYFYNEKVSASATDTVGKGCPAIFLGSGITGYKTGYIGITAFNNFNASNINGTFDDDDAVTLPLPAGSPYRYSSGRLISNYVKNSFYADSTKFLIGNTFQGLDSSVQPIYVIETNDGTDYAFMISSFQNGTSQTGNPATDKRYITLKFKKLN
jgi:hypothetical protein